MTAARAARPVVVAFAAAALSRPATAHVGSLGGTVESNPVPFWLVGLTGGGVIGASFLFTTLVTDHDDIRAVTRGRVGLPLPAAGRAAASALRAAAALALAATLVVGLVGPHDPMRNAAILLVWVGWWAGYTMSTYLVADTWPALNPWRALAAPVARLRAAAGVRERPLPDWGAWPAAVALLALVFVEVVTPASSDPRLLVGVVVAYSAVTVAGAAAFGPDEWFARVDPVSRVFRLYGRLAPVRRDSDGFRLATPGAGLVREDRAAGDETPFVVALLWATTFDGLVSTPTWNRLVGAVVDAGAPALLTYLAAAAAGFALFLASYRWATRAVRETADSYVAPRALRARFAPSLVPIAAGYHLAHFLGYFLTLLPALVVVVRSPLAPPASVPMFTPPGWFGALALVFVLLGHVLAVWVAHAVSFDLFTGRLQPIRSQYPLVAVMILYTVTSMWVVAQPYVPPVHV